MTNLDFIKMLNFLKLPQHTHLTSSDTKHPTETLAKRTAMAKFLVFLLNFVHLVIPEALSNRSTGIILAGDVAIPTNLSSRLGFPAGKLTMHAVSSS